MKKRLLSLILAICMTAALLPTFALSASALEVTLEEGESIDYYFYSNTTNINTDINNKSVSDTLIKNYNTEQKRYWKYITTKNGSVSQMKADRINGYTREQKPSYIVFNIYVPEDGIYEAKYWYYKNYSSANKLSYGGQGDVYILPEGTSLGNLNTAKEAGKRIASVDYSGTDSQKGKIETPEVEKNINLKKGDNILLFLVTGPGVNANAGGDENYRTYPNSLKLTLTEKASAEDEAADGTVSFAQTTNVPDYDDISVETVNRGAFVELTAHKETIPGYKFVGWKRGADTSDENAWVDITGDTYSVWSNTYLTAVYERENDKNVAFWNQNGAYIGKMDEETYNAQDELFTPKLTGFGSFRGWFTDGNVEFTAKQTLATGTTNAVAQYTASAITGVTFNDNAITGADTYNKEITLPATSNATTCWKRDGEIIEYGSSYKFNVWDATNITEGTEEITDKVPVAILDYSNTHKAYMLEYDAGDYEIVEAGIIFGKGTVNEKRYTSQRKENHNQFTVPKEGTLEATGYIIYTLDGGTSYKTKYVSVK